MKHWMKTAAFGMAAALMLSVVPATVYAADQTPAGDAVIHASRLVSSQQNDLGEGGPTADSAARAGDEDEAGVTGLELIAENILYHVENSAALGDGLAEDLDTAVALFTTDDPLGVTWERVFAINALGFLNKTQGTVPNGTLELPAGAAGIATWADAESLGILSSGQTVLPFDTSGIMVFDPANTFVQPGQYCIVWSGDTAERLLEIVGEPSGAEFVQGSMAELVSKFHSITTEEIDGVTYCLGPALRTYGDTLVGDLTKLVDSYDLVVPTVVTVVNTDGTTANSWDRLATGQTLQLDDEIGELMRATVVVTGDVLGSGELSVSQLARLARALNGTEPLSGPYALAGDVDRSGKTTISDLVRLAGMLVR